MSAVHPARPVSADEPVGTHLLAASHALRDGRRLRPIIDRALRRGSPIDLGSLRMELEDRFQTAITLSETAHLCRLHRPDSAPDLLASSPTLRPRDVWQPPLSLPSPFYGLDDPFAWARALADTVAVTYDDIAHVSVELDESAVLDSELDRRAVVRVIHVVDEEGHDRMRVEHEGASARETDRALEQMMIAGFAHRYGEPQALLYYFEGASYMATLILWPNSGSQIDATTIEGLHASEPIIADVIASRIALRQARQPYRREGLEAIRIASTNWGLSARERDVLILLAAGRQRAQIAGELGVSESMVKTHVEHILGKAGVASASLLLAAVFGPFEV